MADEQNKSTTAGKTGSGTTGGTGPSGTAAGMKVSGEQIFSESDKPVDKSSSVEQDVQAAFGGQTGGGQTGGGQNISDTASQAAGQVGELLRGNTSGVTEAAKGALSQVKETTGKVASQALGQVQEKAGTAIDEHKQTLAQGLTSVAGGIRQLGETLRNSEQKSGVVEVTAKYGDTLAEQVESLSRYLEGGDIRDFARDVQGFARRNPAIFVGAAFGVGLLAARFFKSTPRQELMLRSGDHDYSGAQNQIRSTHSTATSTGTGASSVGTGTSSTAGSTSGIGTTGAKGTTGTTGGTTGTTGTSGASTGGTTGGTGTSSAGGAKTTPLTGGTGTGSSTTGGSATTPSTGGSTSKPGTGGSSTNPTSNG
ncbi:MAG TPA: hypothetical protein VEX64_06350 [Pyrinomonadaceae bacterium]|nr:hypothetical protein [Pyrinomonadaceae bacterium]